jgi:hypothetical protein
LSQSFANHGLQFFKVNKTVTHVSVARPNFLDLETTPVSSSIKSIVEFINAHPKCTRRKLLETLAPTPKPTVIEVASDAPPVSDAPTAEQTAIIADLHWLIHQGHVLEFADGRMETAKKPLPRPVKPAKVATDTTKPDEAKQVAAEETISAAEVVATASAEELPPVEPLRPPKWRRRRSHERRVAGKPQVASPRLLERAKLRHADSAIKKILPRLLRGD